MREDIAGPQGASSRPMWETLDGMVREKAQEYRLLPLFNALRMDLGDEAREPHTRQQLGVDVVTLVVGLGNDSEPLGVSEHEVDPPLLESIEEPRPGRTRLDNHLQGLILLEQIIESILLRVLDPDGSGHQLTCIAHDGDHRIRCVSIDSCDRAPDLPDQGLRSSEEGDGLHPAW